MQQEKMDKNNKCLHGDTELLKQSFFILSHQQNLNNNLEQH